VSAAGAVKRDLPTPAKTDDASKAGAAIEKWKALKKQLKPVLDLQVTRLERAMIAGRRWPPEEFEALFVRHPLMTHLVRRFLWAGYPAKGEPILFRVLANSTYTNRDGTQRTLKGLKEIGLIHALHVPGADRNAWQAVFDSAAVRSPFPQLQRTVYAVQSNEQHRTVLARFARSRIHARTLKTALEKGGWSREAQDHGAIDFSCLHFPGADVTAIMSFEPYLLLGTDDTGPHAIPEVTFVRGNHRWPDRKNPALALAHVDPVVFSEVIYLLTGLPSV
jgi:hypothetical protein